MSLDAIMMNEEKKEVIFLLGATGGIGKLLAEELKRNGYIVVGNGRKEEVLISMKNEGKIDDYIVGDLTKDEDRKKIIEKIKEYVNKGYKVSVFYNIGILHKYPGEFKNYTNEMIDISYEINVKSIEKMDNELEKNDFYLDTIYMVSISAFFRGKDWDQEYQKTKAALKAHAEDQILNNNGRRIIALFPDTIKTGEEGMGSKLKEYPKIPGEIFVKKVVEIINGKYKKYSGFIFEIDNNNIIKLYGINPSKITNAFEYLEKEFIEELGKAVY
jgi:short-subunit dehydrogenase